MQKFGKPRPCGKVEEDFESFPSINPFKTRDPTGQAEFDPGAIIGLCRGAQDKTTCKIW